jgi:hypothetical protein
MDRIDVTSMRLVAAARHAIHPRPNVVNVTSLLFGPQRCDIDAFGGGGTGWW